MMSTLVTPEPSLWSSTTMVCVCVCVCVCMCVCIRPCACKCLHRVIRRTSLFSAQTLLGAYCLLDKIRLDPRYKAHCSNWTKIWSGRSKIFHQVEQAREGSANYSQARLSRESLARETKCKRGSPSNNQWAINVKSTTKTSDMALLLVESFAIRQPRRASSGLQVSVDSLLSTSHPWHLDLTLSSLHTQLPFVIL